LAYTYPSIIISFLRVRFQMPLQLVVARKGLEAERTGALCFREVDLLVLREVRGLGEVRVAAWEVAFEGFLFGVFGAVVHCWVSISF
jgi:hypothetical protein